MQDGCISVESNLSFGCCHTQVKMPYTHITRNMILVENNSMTRFSIALTWISGLKCVRWKIDQFVPFFFFFSMHVMHTILTAVLKR